MTKIFYIKFNSNNNIITLTLLVYYHDDIHIKFNSLILRDLLIQLVLQ